MRFRILHLITLVSLYGYVFVLAKWSRGWGVGGGRCWCYRTVYTCKYDPSLILFLGNIRRYNHIIVQDPPSNFERRCNQTVIRCPLIQHQQDPAHNNKNSRYYLLDDNRRWYGVRVPYMLTASSLAFNIPILLLWYDSDTKWFLIFCCWIFSSTNKKSFHFVAC